MYFQVCCDKDIAWKNNNEEYDSTIIDGRIITTHIILEIYELGLGSVVVRSIETQKLKDLYRIPENILPISLLSI